MRGLILLLRRQLHVISRSKTSIIKPASPTPENLKQYNLPLHDRMMPNIYIPGIFFYPNINNSADHKSAISSLLKNSLSETLSKYYPYAGRLRSSGTYVDCNDEGVQFVEAQIGCKLSDILERAPVREDEEGLGHLLPPRTIWDRLSDDKYSSPMLVQLNHFSCGGIGIAVSLSHRIGDALTLFSLVNYWAGLSRNSCNHQKLLHLCPQIVYELLPQSNDDSITFNVPFPAKHWITKEIVFHNSNIKRLQADMEIAGELHYTRNELVTALLYRCATAAAATSNSGEYAKSVLIQIVNIRSMVDPPLLQTSVGNFINYVHIPTSTENETKLNLLAEGIRKGRMQLRGSKNETKLKLLAEGIRKGRLQLRGSKGINETIASTNFEEYAKSNRMYTISSLCNFPLYEIDFGWGRPIKATLVDMAVVDSVTLMDTPNGDGIKAIVGLEEQDMKNFLANRELTNYASF